MDQKKWSREQIADIYHTPLLDLVHQASLVHRHNHPSNEIQICHLISVKTGGCPENCHYCAQSSYYKTNVKAEPMMSHDEVMERAKEAKERGATRICLGAAWREVRNSPQFDAILSMISEINAMGLEACCTLGMLTEEHAERLSKAGLYAYNHNLDTSRKYYSEIVTTRTYDDRLRTLDIVSKADLTVCSGGIIGMGESIDDRLDLLHTLSNLKPQPESVPINILTQVTGTPFGKNLTPVPFEEYVRIIATARIIMPMAMVRLSSGRISLSFSEQTLCFLAGANSLFIGEKLLTVSNPDYEKDEELFRILGVKKRASFTMKKRKEACKHY